MNDELTVLAQKKLEDILTFFGVNTPVEAERDGDTLNLSVETDESGRLIGRRGENLAAIQHLLNMVIKRETDERVYVHVDVAGYKKARGERAVARAIEIAEKVANDGEEAVLPPMTAAERRLVHMELREVEGIETESRGEGKFRRLVIRKSQ